MKAKVLQMSAMVAKVQRYEDDEEGFEVWAPCGSFKEVEAEDEVLLTKMMKPHAIKTSQRAALM
jgi:hypothetical protein